MKKDLLRSVSGLTLACVLGASPVTVHAITAANPYEPIIERNVFGLKPPPPPVDQAALDAAKTPPTKIFLTGITTILGNKRALMKSNPAAKPGETAKEQYYMLTEGQQEGDVEVLSIDEKGGIVRIKNQGQLVSLDITKDAPKAVGAPPAAPVPGMPVPPPMMGMPTPAGAVGGAPGMPNFPTRTLRLPTSGNASGLPGMMGSPTAVGVQPQAGVLGAPGVGGYHQAAPNPLSQLTPEEAALVLEVERERTKSSVMSGTMPPLPTTRYTPADALGQVPAGSELPGQETPGQIPRMQLPVPGSRPRGY